MVTGTAEAQRGIESPKQVAQDMQRELKRVGCFSGRVDGSWGAQSRKAVERFNEAAKLELQAESPNSQDVPKVKNFPGIVCEQVASQGNGPKSSGERPRGEGGGVSITPNIRLRLPNIKSPF
jgi:peptidoglycan hydrolase-like protein with peptidoglycan-binding domain